MKKIKNMKKIITILLASILIFSCSKPKDNPTPVPTNTTTSVIDTSVIDTIQFTITGGYFDNYGYLGVYTTYIDSITTTGNLYLVNLNFSRIAMKIGDTFIVHCSGIIGGNGNLQNYQLQISRTSNPGIVEFYDGTLQQLANGNIYSNLDYTFTQN